ncbi:hypothetical protein ACUNV4_18775 [Granulosicoccus sp. 3-233]|uniref:hypothetical protein n=1 Tax=Granulosicoccus sp. 3-233 TaxID=3417969 RepID=UPI003D34F64E
MNFVECYLCGGLAVQESVRRDLTATIFCTRKLCGRYEITESAMQAVRDGAVLKEPLDTVISRVYIANRHDERVLVSDSDLLSEPTT